MSACGEASLAAELDKPQPRQPREGENFSDAFGDMAGKALVAALPPAAVLAAVVGLVGKGVGVERKTEKADSGELAGQVLRDTLPRVPTLTWAFPH